MALNTTYSNLETHTTLFIFPIRGNRIRAEEDLAYDQNISLSQIASIETGKLNPTICTLKKIAHGLSIDLAELLKF